MEEIFKQGLTTKKYARFVTPSVIMFVFIALYSVVDGVFVANYVGSDALAAINIIAPLSGIIWGVSVMLAAGSSAIVAIKMGEGKEREANEKFTLICIVSIIFSLLFVLTGLFFLEDILAVIGATPRLMPYCMAYGQIIVFSAPFAFLSVILEYFIRVDGKPGFTLFLYVIGGVTNIILDYIFIDKLQMGIAGAAYATGAGLAVATLLGLAYFLLRPTKLKFVLPKMDFRYVGHCMFNGSSEMVTECSVGFTTLLFNLAALRFAGEDGVAALTIVLYAHYLLVSAYLGYVAGVAPLISYYFGAKNYPFVNKCLNYSKNFLIVTALAIFAFAELAAPLLATIFSEYGTAVYDMALTGLRLVGVSFLFAGVNIFASGLFTAYANGKISALISMSRALIMVVIGYIFLPKLFALNGIWLTVPFAEIMTLIPTIFFLWHYRKKYHYSLKPQEEDSNAFLKKQQLSFEK